MFMNSYFRLLLQVLRTLDEGKCGIRSICELQEIALSGRLKEDLNITGDVFQVQNILASVQLLFTFNCGRHGPTFSAH